MSSLVHKESIDDSVSGFFQNFHLMF